MRLLLTLAILAVSVCEVHAQAPTSCTAPCTKSQLLNDVQTLFPDNTVGAITPSILRTFQTNLLNSSMPTAPTGTGAFACYTGTTGLLGNCTSPLGLSLGGTGAITQQGAATAVFPAPTRPGDIAYWTGTSWATVQGNNTGSQVLTESSAGVPSWATYTNGTVTSIVVGTGLSGGTITTSGTVALNVQALTTSLSGDVTITNNTNYFDGPSVSQGTTGTWFASGFVTLIDGVAASNVFCKLWDGTTVIANGRGTIVSTSQPVTLTLSGIITSPAGNIKISCKDITAANGAKIVFSDTDSNAHSSTLTVLRIQ